MASNFAIPLSGSADKVSEHCRFLLPEESDVSNLPTTVALTPEKLARQAARQKRLKKLHLKRVRSLRGVAIPKAVFPAPKPVEQPKPVVPQAVADRLAGFHSPVKAAALAFEDDVYALGYQRRTPAYEKAAIKRPRS